MDFIDFDKENIFSKLGKFVAKSIQNKIIVGAACLCVVGGGIGAGVAIYNATNSQKEPVAEASTSSTEESSSEEMVDINITDYKGLFYFGESMEKDLTVYFTLPEGGRIKGEEFKVVLTTMEEAYKLDDAVSKIKSIKAELEEAEERAASSGAEQTNQGEHSSSVEFPSSDVETSSSETSTENDIYIAGLTYKQFAKLTEVEQLSLKKAEAIKEYKELVEKAEGTVFVDEDRDGKIYKDSLTSGLFCLCYIPLDNYDPDEYIVYATIKEQIEYVKVENIENIVEEFNAAEDQAPVQREQENVLKDTVKYVESRIEPGKFQETAPANGAAYAAGVIKQTLMPVENTPTNGAPSGTPEGEDGANDAPSGTPEGQAGANGTVFSLEGPEKLYFYSNCSDRILVQLNGSGIKKFVNPLEDSRFEIDMDNSDLANGKYMIIITDTDENASGKYTFSAITNDGQTITYEADYYIYSKNEPIKDADGTQLFVGDGETKELAYAGNWNGKDKLYKEISKQKYYGWQIINTIRYYYDENGNKVTGNQVINGQEYKFGTDGALLTGGFGIDVSFWNGNLDWEKIRTTASFAIIRAGVRYRESRNIAEDTTAAANITGANAAGVKVGLYFYSTATKESEAVEEASLAISVAQKYGSISLPIYIDMEDSIMHSLTTQQRDAIVMAFCNTIVNSGYRAGVYSNLNWYTNYLTPSSYPGWVSIWYAQWNDVPTYNGRYDIWQRGSSDSIPGTNGIVDINESYF